MLGVVNLDKPAGPTSHDMVAMVRRLTGMRRIGHAGTLDPLASGVLPILVGGATRFSEELTAGAKRYRAVVRLGARSATDDAEGPITPTQGPVPGEEEVRSALEAFTGTFAQRPPAFSARKVGGRTAHRAARAGTLLDLPPRQVTVEMLELLALGPSPGGLDVEVDLRCGPGTYVRSLARDLGERLGTGGYLLSLRRTEAAGLSVDDSVSPEQLERLAGEGRLSEALLRVDDLLPLPALDLSEDAARRFVHGNPVPLAQSAGGRFAVRAAGGLLGIGRVEAGLLRPEKVLAAAAEQ